MTVKEVIRVLKNAKKIRLYYGDNSVEFHRDDMVVVEVFGNYVVENVYALSECEDGAHYEIDVLMQPVVAGMKNDA